MASFIASKMHRRVCGTQVGIYFVPGHSQEFLFSSPSASFNQTLSLPKSLLSVDPALLERRGMGSPWLCRRGSHDLALLPVGLEVGV